MNSMVSLWDIASLARDFEFLIQGPGLQLNSKRIPGLSSCTVRYRTAHEAVFVLI